MEGLDESSQERPRATRNAVFILTFSLTIGLVRLFIESSRLSQMASLLFLILISAFVFGFYLSLFGFIWRGANWGRIVFMVAFVTGIPLSVDPLLKSLAENLFAGILGIIQVIIELVAVVLLFAPKSNHWFRYKKEEKKRLRKEKSSRSN